MKRVRLELALACILLLSSSLRAQTPIQIFYVPVPEDEARQFFLALAPGLPDTAITTTIAITAAGNGTILYYDHWEDGYEADITNPLQATSQIWGDVNLATGAPPGCTPLLMPACDTINAGRIIILTNDVPVPRVAPPNFFDGRDKFATTLLVAATQAAWPATTGTVIADSTEIFPENDWGTSYEVPGGENLAGTMPMFEDARVVIMAQRANTIVRVDVNDDGVDDIVQVLNEGQTLTVDAVQLGARVNSNLPVQTLFLNGDIGVNYESRWYMLVPRNRWTNRYIAPVGTTDATDAAVVLLYNPHTTALTINASTTSGTTPVNVPAGGLVKFQMPLNSGALFQSSDNRNFFAIASIDDEGRDHDWGHVLLPASTLAPAVKAGWAPGSTTLSPAQNYSPIWVTAASATTLNVDWNDDGTVDQTVAIGALQSVRLLDADGDQTGARIFTTDGTLISAAWGQDPLGTPIGLPALDLGTSVLPAPDVTILKNSNLANDVNGNGLLDPGDTLLYNLFVLNTGVVDANNVIVTDAPDPYTTYAPNTTEIDLVPYPDDLPPGTPFPLDGGGIDLQTLLGGPLVPGQGLVITYQRVLGDPLPSPQQQIINTAQVTYGTGVTVSSTEVNPVTPPQFNVTKTSNLVSPALPGQVITYTISILNNSPITQTAITVTDPLPAGTTYIAQSTTASVPLAFQSYRDEFNAQAYNNSNGTVSWATSWVETDPEGGGSTGGDVSILNNVSNYQLRVRDNGAIYREANLSGFAAAVLSFSYRRDGLDNASEWVDVQVSSNGGASWTFLDRFIGPATDPGYTNVSYDISAYRAANTRIRFIANPAGMSNSDAVWFENVQIAAPPTLTKTNQAAATNPLVDGNPPSLVVAGDGFSLAPNQTLTVTVQVQVNDPLNPFLPSILNQATINSAQSLTPTLVTRLDPVAPGSILGDRVWLDVDGDGVQDIGEVGLSNVRVRLFRDPNGVPGSGDEVVMDQMFTDGNGNYLFDRIYPPLSGTYYVEVDATTLPAGLSPSPGNNNGRSASITITGLQTILDLDFGYTAAPGTAVVGDRIWSDADGDGVQDPGELGIGGVTVNLMAPGADGLFGTGDDVVVGTRATAPDGTYLFVGVTPGFYRIDVTDTGSVLTGYTLTFGSDPTTSIQLTAGDVDVSRDFGYRNPSLFSISDAVWDDADADGVRDPGENGTGGVTIALRDGSGNLVGTTVSDANGNFQFGGVGNGNYTIVVTDTGGLLVNAAPTTIHATAGQRAVVVAGANVANVSFGYRNLGAIGELVWSDADGDGVRDPSEPGIAGVTIQYIIAGLDGLFGTADDAVIGTGTTAADGTYLFTAVPRGYYRVQVTDTGGVLAGFTQTGDPDAVLDAQGDVPLLAGAVNLTMNFGYQNASLADVSGNVFNDTDLDGLRDAGESGISSVTLNLTAAGPDGIFGTVDDLVLATTATDASGNYVFADVPNGNYRVVVTDTGNVLNGYTLTSGLDSIPVSVTGANVSNVNFGYARSFGTATIGVRVWLDANRDGVQNPSEDGIGNVTLNLYTSGAVLVGIEITDTAGYYQFTNLPAGDYYVDLVSGLPPGLTATVGTTDPTGLIQLASGQSYIGANFGYASASGSAIGDSVFYDANRDGFQNPGEVGIGGVQVTVTGPSGTFSVTTNPDGSWLVAGLAPGTYVVTVNTGTLPAGYNTTPTNGPATRAYPVTAGRDFLRADFGFNAPAGMTGTIGDTVFFDANGNGSQNAGEGGISGVTLRLLNASGVAIATTTTGAAGTYDFLGVPPGNYVVEVTDIFGALTGLNLSAGTNPSGTIALAAGGDVNDVDFGYAPSAGTGSMGGFIWHDADASGAVNGAESSRGIQGVSVNLYLDVNGNGVVNPGVDNLIRTTTTDVIGEYQMFGIPPGSYLVDVTDTSGVLAGFSKTTGAAGVDNNSQADPYAVALAAGTTNFTADFGYVAAGTNSIQGTTFFDVIGDGLLNGPDSGIGNVTVYLYRDLDADGVLDVTDPRISVQLSSSSGGYNFTNLPDGNFIVAVDVTGTFLQSSYQTTQLLTAGVQPVTLSGSSSTGNHFGFNITATLVNISRFDLYEEDGQAVVEWVTGSEVGTLGFYLFRWDPSTRGYIQVNDALLPGLRAPQGGLYRLADERAPRKGTLTYVLFEAEEGGGERRYGPFEVQMRGRSSGRGPLASGFERRARRQSPDQVERAERGRARRAAAREGRGGAGDGRRARRSDAALKIAVPSEGVYFLSVSQIASALGRSEAEVGALLSRGNLNVTNRGRNVAWLPASDGSGLSFYGEKLETQYASENVYWLAIGAGKRIAGIDGTPGIDGASFYLHSAHLEQELFAATLASTDPDSDFWYWSSLIASYPAYSTANYVFEASAVEVSGAPLAIQVNAFGATSTPHRLRLRVNGATAGEGAFHEVGTSSIRVEVDPSLLVPGTNTVSVQAILEPGTAFDVVYIDSLDISYSRRHEAVADALSFRAASDGAVLVHGFAGAGAVVLDVTRPETPKVVTGAAQSAGAVRFAAGIDRSYFAFSGAAQRFPPVELVESLGTLRTGGADYVVIAPESLAAAAAELSEHRQGQGLDTRVVTVETIHDELGFGIPSPLNVQSFLRHALEKWRPAPRFVVLIGKGTYDFKDVYRKGDNLMTPLMASTPLGLYASDNRLADVFGGDGLPDVMIGRIPVLSDEELRAYVSKLAAFEGSGLGEAIFLADDPDAAGNFGSDSHEMASLVPPSVAAHRIHLGELPVSEARARLFDQLLAGAGYWNYIGHGGLDRFANEGLMLAADVPLLANGRTPILASLTCTVGRFEIPGWSSLAEALVMKEGGGAIAAWSPSGLSYNSQALILNRALIEALYDENTQFLGEAIKSSLSRFAEEGQLPFMLSIYNLLGDPATRLR